MKIKAEDTAALIIDFQEKLVPAIADHDEIVAKAAIFAAGLKEFGVPMAVTQQYTKGLGETVPAMKEAIGAFEPMEKTVFSAMGKGTGQKDNFGLRRGSTYLRAAEYYRFDW